MTSHLPSRVADDHAAHDRQLIVAHACGDLGPDEARDARALLERCRRCAALDGEIRLSPSLARHLAVPARPRDFRLTADDAVRLRGSTLRRLLRRLGGPGLASLQPLAAAALGIGLLLVVTTTALPGLFAGAGAGGASPAEQREVGTGDALGPLASQQPAPGPTTGPLVPVSGDSQAIIDTTNQGSKTLAPPSVPAPASDPALLIGLGLVVVAGVLLVVRLTARRVAEDPLLR